MKVMTVLGTRPEIIRLSLILKLLDKVSDHTVVFTGQNFEPLLSEAFFRELDLRAPDEHLGVRGISFGDQVGQILARVEEVLRKVRPDRLLLLGDTNSALSALVAARLGVTVLHMEAGNRCFDDRVPEEVNRRVVDHCSTILMPYSHRSKENLLREGIERERIYVVGNPIVEVLRALQPRIEQSDVLKRHGVQPGGYFLATLHRAENVDIPARLESLMQGVSMATARHGIPAIVSVHPRTADRLRRYGLDRVATGVKLVEPLGLIDFVALEQSARAVLTDSGTVQEECAVFRIPNVTLRDVTERPETLECGSSILTSADSENIVRALDLVVSLPSQWAPPPDYLVPQVAETVTRLALGHISIRRHGCSSPNPAG